MAYDFGLNLHKLIDIPGKKGCNVLEEGTFGLRDKKTNDIAYVRYDYKQILEEARKIIKYDEDSVIWPQNRYNGEHPEFWKLENFLKQYDLVFHEFMPLAWQAKHRLEFINELFDTYYEHKFEAVLMQDLRQTPGNLGYLFSEFIKFKKLKNRIAIKKLPVLCALSTKDNIKEIDQLIAYLFDQFEQDEFTLDVKTDRYEGTKILLALKSQDIVNYIGLTVFENWKVDAKADFMPLIQYMDSIEKYIETKYLR